MYPRRDAALEFKSRNRQGFLRKVGVSVDVAMNTGATPRYTTRD